MSTPRTDIHQEQMEAEDLDVECSETYHLARDLERELNAAKDENALLRDALSKAERLIFGAHGASFLPGQMRDYNLAVSKIPSSIK